MTIDPLNPSRYRPLHGAQSQDPGFGGAAQNKASIKPFKLTGYRNITEVSAEGNSSKPVFYEHSLWTGGLDW